MEFGLWVEPEMVNPDSDLYRTHPDWVLKIPSAPLILSRHQLVLDLTRDEVQNYLFERLNELLIEYPIRYLKWDMNRAIHQPGDQSGRAVGHEQIIGVYRLLSRVRDTHPEVEIESCSSGGGRADYGILTHTDRIWTSDNNDALDRLDIQKGFSMFFPSEVMGSHVGPNVCHLTDRQISMETRVGVSMFSHMGVEANLSELDDNQIKALKAGIELHKEHRDLIHGGTLVRLDTDTLEHSFGIVASDKREAIFSYTQIDSLQNSVGGSLLFVGLDKDRIYSIRIIWPEQPQSYSKSILDVINGSQISGEALINVGVQLPIMKPASLLVFHLLCVD
jgi:alpha-galactosidase